MITEPSKITKAFQRIDDFNEFKEKVKTLFDLSESEVSTYMILLMNDRLTAAELSKIAGIQRTRIYEIFRRLKEKELVTLSSENPQRFSVVSPRIAIDNWLFKRRRLLEEKSSQLLGILPTLQKIWNDQHEELLGTRVSLISEDNIREIIPQEMKIAQKKLCLALRDPSLENPQLGGSFIRLFDPRAFHNGIQNFLERGVQLQILIGDPDIFLKRAHPHKLKSLARGLIDETIEVRALNKPFPQSFLLVDDERVYLFFLSNYRESQNEAIRAESQSLREFFSLVWQKFWNAATPLTLEKVLNTEKTKNI